MFEIIVEDRGRRRVIGAVRPPWTLGRQPDDRHPQLVLDDPFVSRRQAVFTQAEPGTLRIRCDGRADIHLSDGVVISQGSETILPLPIQLRVGRSLIRVREMSTAHTVVRPPIQPRAGSPPDCVMPPTLNGHRESLVDDVTSDRLIEWFERLISLQGGDGTRDTIMQRATEAVVRLIGLDSCVLVTASGQEAPAKAVTPLAEAGEVRDGQPRYSRSVFQHVLRYGQTAYDSTSDLAQAASLANASAFVGAPIFDSDGKVFASLFGVRYPESGSVRGVLPIEAQLVQVIAGIVSTRLARLDAEAERVRIRVQLEQFASPQLVREMEANPEWLEAQQKELTILFGDIRNFSRMSEQLGARPTFELVRAVMDLLTEIIHEHGGFIFNFAGDGIAAMWNAPEPLPNHVDAACRTALAITQRMQEPIALPGNVPSPIQVGLGIHTGPAIVGNSGSRHRLKYSPLGHVVNLASRIEGATKHMGVEVLSSAAVRNAASRELSPCFRDVGEIRVAGIHQGVRVYRLATRAIDPTFDAWDQFDQGLRHFEAGQADEARSILSKWSHQFPHDNAARVLLRRLNEGDGSPGPWEIPK